MISNYLKDLEKFYSNRGINLKKTGNKWSFRTSSEDLTEDLTIFKEKKRKMSRAALRDTCYYSLSTTYYTSRN